MHKREQGVSNAFLGFAAGLIALASVVALIYVIAVLGDDSSDASSPQDVYVSMGDSVAAGVGASNSTTTSFPALIAVRREVTLFNVAEAGATSQAVIDEQLRQVLPLLGSGRVQLITISVGGNDLAPLISNDGCVEDPPPESCPLDEMLDGVEGRVGEILRLLREDNARVPIVLLGYPNFFSGTGHPWEAPAARVLAEFAARLQRQAAVYDRIVVAMPSFDGRGGELTHLEDAHLDPHPNDAGHRVIADAMLAALHEIEE